MTTHVMDSSRVSDVHVKTDAVFPIALGALFLLVYTQGYIERIGVSGNIVKLIIEVPVFVVMLHLMNRGEWPPVPGFLLVALYVVWSAVSAIFNGDNMYVAFLYCRYVVYAYIVFAAVWSTPLTRTALMRLNTILALLFIVQIAASAYEVFVRGERIEAHVGALYADGGALATEFPLLAMGLTVPFYLYYRRNPLLLLLAWAFFLVGYASGKRAIYFLGPSLYLFILGWHVVRTRTLYALKQSLWGASIFICLIPLVLVGMSRSIGLGQNDSDGPWERVVQALHMAYEYTVGEGPAGQTWGRTGTNRLVFSTLQTGQWETILSGRGGSAMREGEEGLDDLPIGYGICGWARDVLCIGWPGMILYVVFHFTVFRRLRWTASLQGDPYWLALRFGVEISFVVLAFVYFSYSPSLSTSGQLSYVYFYLLALLTSPQHRHIVRNVP